ncbi:uncharacterized protein LOC113284491 [Papaver somniferum]|nr:uncharacterized protein LOC113284491 [Papaver somniferum]XP_026389762.1 uncharacterized protein LOC113284491 [Papaver somniferum]XP_026389763.1 uncharacterized protein LOC113284491 [Papaver somniferum]XP_026389764.1 uncharacterized protein LOC113284491 [Papaver somniferum]XP_026389765.1 uncharacterized protein LOC113284491 [Papaver somniferum]XP_026389766.1 uncharacterized protein LOC113284491 [Papaver somniferum]XP_026389768.1 uncharacterized protein LOC113284491 [Papaver somniferum]XP_0
MGRRSKKRLHSRRTKITEMTELDEAYHDGEKFIMHEMEDPETYWLNGIPCEKSGWQPPVRPDVLSANFDASGSKDKKSLGYGYHIRNRKGMSLLEGFGRAKDPCNGNNTGYMEIYAYSKMLRKVNPKLCPKLEARCDNLLAINILKGTVAFDKHTHGPQLVKLMKYVRKLVNEKYPKGSKERFIEYKWVCREENFLTDHLSHLGGRLDFYGEMPNPSEVLKKNWTYKFLWNKDRKIGFCKFPELRRIALERHNDNKKFLICPNCNQKGHKVEDCKAGAISPSQRRCYHCNQPGHLARNCEAKGTGSEQSTGPARKKQKKASVHPKGGTP